MNGINQILVIGAMLFLSTLVLMFHQVNASHTSTSNFNEAVVYASGFAQSMMDEIQSKSFDERTVAKWQVSTDSLSLLLGPDLGESSVAAYDDVDDYNGHVRIDTLSRLGDFSGRVRVSYVSTMNPDNLSLVRTFSKTVDLSVYNYYLDDVLTDTLRFSHVISY